MPSLPGPRFPSCSRRPRFAWHAASLLALALLPLPLGACSSSGGAPDAGQAVTAEPLTPVPAPAGLVGELYVTVPGDTWKRARGLVGGAAMFLPQGFPALCTTLVGLPITVSPEIDDGLPVLGAAVRHDKDPLQGVIGIHVKAGGRFVDQLTKGEGARFDPKVDPESRVTLLVEKATQGAEGRYALGVLGDYLLVARKAADLYAVGPYVARTLSAAPPPKEAVVLELPESALGGPIAAEVRARAEGASAALAPLAGLADNVLTLLPDAAHARVTVTLDDAAVHAHVTVTPKPGGGPATKLLGDLAAGDTAPLLDLPDGTSLGIFWRESAAGRAESAPKQAAALAHLLRKDLSAEDKDAIGSALRAEAEARGDWQAVGVDWSGKGPTAVVRAPAADADHMRKALKQLVDLAGLPSFKKTLAALGLKLATEKAVVENLPADVIRVRLSRLDADGKDDKAKPEPKAKADPKGAAADPGDTPKSIDLLYFVDKDGLFAAAGFDPKDALRGLVKAKDGHSLRSVAPMAQALSAAGGDVAFALIADVPRITAMTTGAAAPKTPSPLVLAAGRTREPAELWGRLDVPSVVVQELVQEYAKKRAGQAPAP
jgi:hypothetical protein